MGLIQINGTEIIEWNWFNNDPSAQESEFF